MSSSHALLRWTEHEPMEIMDSVHTCIAETLKQAGDVEVVAIGITNQRETTLVWDRVTGKPLYNAIVWLVRSEPPPVGMRPGLSKSCAGAFNNPAAGTHTRLLLSQSRNVIAYACRTSIKP